MACIRYLGKPHALFINLCTIGRVRSETCLAPAPGTCIRKLLSGCLEVHLLLLGVAALGDPSPVSRCQGPRFAVAEVIRLPQGKQAAGIEDSLELSFFFFFMPMTCAH